MIKKLNFHLHIDKSRGETVVFSLPQSNHYHTISNLDIGTNEIVEEPVWKNKVAVMGLDLVRGAVSFSAQLQEFQPTLPQFFTLKNYQNKIPDHLLLPSHFISGKDQEILSLAKRIVKTEKSWSAIIRNLYDFTLEYLTYGATTEGLYTYKQALEERTTDCGGFSTFLGSLLQALHIPNRLVVGFLLRPSFLKSFLVSLDLMSFNFRSLYMHTWIEVLLPDKIWFPLDASIEWQRNKGLISSQGGFGFTPADRLVTSFGQDFETTIVGKKYKTDLLQKPLYIN